MSKKRIIHVAQANGGVECYLKMFFKYSNNSAYENYLILSYQYKESVKYFEEMGIKVFLLDMRREISPISDFIAMVNILKIIIKLKANIVYCHSSKAGGLARIPAKLCGAKIFYNPHGWAFDITGSRLKKKIYMYIEKILGTITDEIVAISRYEMEIAINSRIVKKSNIVLIENAIDLENINNDFDSENTLKELGWDYSNTIIGMVARISEQKSPITFLDIAEKALEHIPNARFIMVGDGEQRAMVEEIIRAKNLEKKIHITGWVDNAIKYIDIFDFAILTSKWEGFGLVIPEYMLSKKPVVASNVGGISNIIENGKNGFLVDNLNYEDYVSYIIKLNENKLLRESIVNEGYKTVIKKYDFKRVIKQHEKLFNY